MHRRLLWILLLPLACSLGCGASHQQVVEPYLARYDALREKLLRVKDLLANQPAAELAPGALDPPLSLLSDDLTDNADGLMYEELADPGSRETLPFDMYLSDCLSTAMHWTSDERRTDQGSPDNPAFVKRVLEAGLQVRYLVVHRVDQLTLPTALEGGKEFTLGTIALTGFVVDLEDEKVVASYQVTAVTPAQVDFVYKETESPEERLKAFAKSSMYTSARKQIEEKLSQTTGGTVKLD